MKDLPVGTFVAVLVIWAASFLVWMSGLDPMFRVMVEGSAWTSTLTVSGLGIPNWTLTVIATIIGVLKFFEAKNIYTTKRWIFIATAVYGVIHSGLFMLILVANSATVGMGLGVPITFAAYVFLVISSFKKRNIPAPVLQTS